MSDATAEIKAGREALKAGLGLDVDPGTEPSKEDLKAAHEEIEAGRRALRASQGLPLDGKKPSKKNQPVAVSTGEGSGGLAGKAGD